MRQIAVQRLDELAAMRKRRSAEKKEQREAEEEHDSRGDQDPAAHLAPASDAQVILPEAGDLNPGTGGFQVGFSVRAKRSQVDMRTRQHGGPATARELPCLRQGQVEARGDEVCLPPNPDHEHDDESNHCDAADESQDDSRPNADALQPDKRLAGPLGERGMHGR